MTSNECLDPVSQSPKMGNLCKTVVIIPAYNEGAGIAGLLGALASIAQLMPLQVVLVNDGSTDTTGLQASLFLDRMKLKIISHSVNKGVPCTLYDGLSAAANLVDAGDCLVLIEGDGTSDLKILPALVEAVRLGADIVIGSRQLGGGGYRNFPAHRVWGSRLTNFLLRCGLRVPNVSDYTIFYRAYKAGIVQRVLAKYGSGLITSRSFAANVELLLRLAPYARRISEIPFRYDYGLKESSSKMQLGKTLIECVRLIWKRWASKI